MDAYAHLRPSPYRDGEVQELPRAGILRCESKYRPEFKPTHAVIHTQPRMTLPSPDTAKYAREQRHQGWMQRGQEGKTLPDLNDSVG